MQIGRAYSFKQLCEQSDSSLRQYLGKPSAKKRQDKNDEVMQSNDFSSSLLDSFGMDSSSSDSDEDDYREQISILSTGMTNEPINEKLIAQQQLLKLARNKKSRNRKKKIKKTLQNGQVGKDFYWFNSHLTMLERFKRFSGPNKINADKTIITPILLILLFG